ncbi:methyltransferase domain-containing protein [Streptomyces bobili]|uniref:methyltransferase domain-containing protein n=1 Tax=Streptomyces bobili TaxID=67280 RepID=UPI0036EB0C27
MTTASAGTGTAVRRPARKLLGDLTDLVVAELGSGAGHRAAHLARTGQPARIVAVDHDVHRTADARAHYGHLPLLRLVQADAAVHMSGHPRGFDVVYSVFGALDFADPHPCCPPSPADCGRAGCSRSPPSPPTSGTRPGLPRAAARPRTPRPGTSSWTGTAST